VLASLDLPAIRVLRLSGNPFGAASAAVIAKRLPAWPALEQLDLRETQVSDSDVAALRATGTRARIVVDKELPSRLAIDAIGSELELTRVSAPRSSRSCALCGPARRAGSEGTSSRCPSMATTRCSS
jgi:hypothetical protein